jgi:predicted ArsR family transcriptional regulator
MANGSPSRDQIERFLVDKIDTVPQLEALLLMWRNRPRQWTSDQIAQALYISPELARVELHYLEVRELISVAPGPTEIYALNLEPEGRPQMLAALEETYRRELVRISTLIHAKAPRSMRDFASAFRFKKEEKK